MRREWVIRALGRILVYMRSHRLSINRILGDSFLVDTHTSDSTECAGVDFGASIGNDAYHDLLPSILAPSFAPISLAQVGDVLHNAVH